MSELTDKEKIEYLEMELKDVYEDSPLQMIEAMIWDILDLSPKSSEEEDAELRNALEVLYKNVFCEDPEIMYKDMMKQEKIKSENFVEKGE